MADDAPWCPPPDQGPLKLSHLKPITLGPGNWAQQRKICDHLIDQIEAIMKHLTQTDYQTNLGDKKAYSKQELRDIAAKQARFKATVELRVSDTSPNLAPVLTLLSARKA